MHKVPVKKINQSNVVLTKWWRVCLFAGDQSSNYRQLYGITNQTKFMSNKSSNGYSKSTLLAYIHVLQSSVFFENF